MKNIPFQYGRIVTGADFTDREAETRHLANNFLALTNTAIISPRRWGKSSLVEHAIESLDIADAPLFVRLNAFGCKTPEEFYSMLAKGVMRDLSSSFDNLMSNAKDFLSRLAPKVSISDPTGQYDISFGVGYDSPGSFTEDILDLPQKLAEKRKRSVVVCIDEFQQVGEFKDTLSFQRTLRSSWQRHKDVAYCLYGSKRNMMTRIFADYDSPFYKFGDLFFLPKIGNGVWVDYIMERFRQSGKRISAGTCSRMARLVEDHPYYVQQLAQMSWFRCGEVCTDEDVDAALDGIIDMLNMQFFVLADSLSAKQTGFLMAVANGEKNLSSESVLRKYRYGPSANVKNLKASLEKKDLIDISGRTVSIQDPMLRIWLKRNYSTLVV